MDADGKFQALEAYLSQLLSENVAIAFSGGVDSSLLLRMCREAAAQHGTRVLAYTVHSDMHPVADIDHARRQALAEGVEHTVVRVNELEEAGIADNLRTAATAASSRCSARYSVPRRSWE